MSPRRSRRRWRPTRRNIPSKNRAGARTNTLSSELILMQRTRRPLRVLIGLLSVLCALCVKISAASGLAAVTEVVVEIEQVGKRADVVARRAMALQRLSDPFVAGRAAGAAQFNPG